MARTPPATPSRRSWPRCVMSLLLLLLGVPLRASAQEGPVVTGPQQPPITIVLKGGAGIIKVDRTWTKGAHLCWESRGVRKCTPQKMVSYVRYDGVGASGGTAPRQSTAR